MRKEELPDTHYIPGSLKSCLHGKAKIQEVRESPAAQGRAELIAHLEGKRLYASKAIKAYCFSCMGYFEDGKADCRDPECPLYPFMPYSQKKNVPADQLAHLPEKNGKGLVCSDVA